MGTILVPCWQANIARTLIWRVTSINSSGKELTKTDSSEPISHRRKNAASLRQTTNYTSEKRATDASIADSNVNQLNAEMSTANNGKASTIHPDSTTSWEREQPPGLPRSTGGCKFPHVIDEVHRRLVETHLPAPTRRKRRYSVMRRKPVEIRRFVCCLLWVKEQQKYFGHAMSLCRGAAFATGPQRCPSWIYSWHFPLANMKLHVCTMKHNPHK